MKLLLAVLLSLSAITCRAASIGGGGAGISGTGAANRVTVWDGATSVTGTADFTSNNGTLFYRYTTPGSSPTQLFLRSNIGTDFVLGVLGNGSGYAGAVAGEAFLDPASASKLHLIGSGFTPRVTFDAVNNRLGIRNTAPAYPLDVSGTAHIASPLTAHGQSSTDLPASGLTVGGDALVFKSTDAAVEGFTSILGGAVLTYGFPDTTGIAAFTGVCSSGSEAAPTACEGGNILNFIGGKAYDGVNATTATPSAVAVNLILDEDATPTARGSHIDLETTKLTTATRRKRLRVNPLGQVIIAPRAQVITPQGALDVTGVDAGIGEAGNGVSIYAREGVTVGAGTNIVYRCVGGADDGVIFWNNTNAGHCVGGTYTASSLKVD